MKFSLVFVLFMFPIGFLHANDLNPKQSTNTETKTLKTIPNPQFTFSKDKFKNHIKYKKNIKTKSNDFTIFSNRKNIFPKSPFTSDFGSRFKVKNSPFKKKYPLKESSAFDSKNKPFTKGTNDRFRTKRNIKTPEEVIKEYELLNKQE